MLNSRDVTDQQRLLQTLYYLTAAALLLLLRQETEDESLAIRILQSEDEADPVPPPRKIRRKSTWVRDWLSRRPAFGQYDQLLTELHREDRKGYKNFLRITPELFHEMVEKITPILEKKKKKKLHEGAVGRGAQVGYNTSFLGYWRFV